MAFGFRKSEPEFSSDPAVTLPIYLKFVQKHLARGGKVNYSVARFESAQLEYQRGGTIRVDESRRTVVAGKGTKIEQPDLGDRFYDDEPVPVRPNTTVYQLDGYKTVGDGMPTVYADVEFDAILNGQQEQERRDDAWEYVAQGYSDLVPSRLGGTAPDTYALPQNAPEAVPVATPTAEQLKQDEIVLAALSEAAEIKGQVTLPSGRTVDPDAMRAFQTAFGNSGAPVSPTAGTADRTAAPAAAAQQKTTAKPDRGLEQS